MRRPLNCIVAGISLLFVGLGARTSDGVPEGSGSAVGMRGWIEEGQRSERVRIAIELQSLVQRAEEPATAAEGVVPLGVVPLGAYSVPHAAAVDADADLLGIPRGVTAINHEAL